MIQILFVAEACSPLWHVKKNAGLFQTYQKKTGIKLQGDNE